MRHLSLCLLLPGLLAGCGSLASHPPRHVDLSGQWQLNESLSDDPMAVMREHRPHGMRRGSGGMHRRGGDMPWLNGPGGYGGGHHGGGQGGAGGGWPGGGLRRGPANDFLSRPEELSIQQSSKRLKLIADGVPTDYEFGEKVVASVQGGAADRTSGWKGQDFVVRYHVNGGPNATRNYELGDAGKQLIVITKVSGERSMTLRAIYDREPGVSG